uniref:Uncharacterized protein n=1 Tax=Pan paniscus TaxID=9597 RepID=A0A2R9ASF0_PANPA
MDRTETRFRGMGQILGKLMTSHQPHPQDEEQSPQPSASGYPLQEVVDDEVSGPSAPGVDPSPPCRSFCWKRKREWSDKCEEEPEKKLTPEPEETWVVEMLCGLKMKLKQQRVSPVLPEHHEAFNNQIGSRTLSVLGIRKLCFGPGELTPEIPAYWEAEARGLLEFRTLRLHLGDRAKPCLKRKTKAGHSSSCLISWLWSAYFSRASLFSWQYQRIYFFLALYLANDMEEDSETPKQNIFYFLYGKNCSQIALFHMLHFRVFRSVSSRRWVGPGEVEEIQAYDPEPWVWARDRTHLS